MQLELDDPAPESAEDRIDRLTLDLLGAAHDQSVRVIEALAATLVNGANMPAPTNAMSGLCEDSAPITNFGAKLALCRRIARRAIGRSLIDPTRGATSFHRLDETPDWARDLLPVATFGPFLFYRR